MSHMPEVVDKSTGVERIDEISSRTWFWTVQTSSAQPLPFAADGVLPEVSDKHGSDIAPLSNVGLSENVADVSTDIRHDTNTSTHLGSLIDFNLASIVDETPDFSFFTQGGKEETHLSPIVSPVVEAYEPFSTPMGSSVLSTPVGGHFYPPSLESPNRGFFQQGYTSDSADPYPTSWNQGSIPNNASSTIRAISTPRSESWSVPINGRKCDCECRYSHAPPLSSHIKTLPSVGSDIMQLNNQQRPNESGGYRTNRRQRHRSHWTILQQQLCRPLRVFDSTSESSWREGETTDKQRGQSSPMTTNSLEELLNALDNEQNDYGLSILLDFLRPTNTNTTNAKNNNPGSQGKGPQTYICLFNHCGKRLERKDRALGHVRMHLGYRPYVCNGQCGVEGCKEAFACHSYLKSHKQRPKETCLRCGISLFKKDFVRHTLFCHSA
ncbi:hypothetical protein FRC18_000570 [Serendipita sp. 400]|nr:hypothetical protein FRC18_000570 [Serendipita sp. 400]